MKISQVLITLMAVPALAMPSPLWGVPAPANGEFSAMGKCNGNSCDMGSYSLFKKNKKCDEGSCTGTHGGDGAACGKRDGKGDRIYCPGYLYN